MKPAYDAFGFYHDATDPRLVVPKRVPAFGWTLNLEHRHGPLVLAAIFGVLAGATIIAIG